MPKRDPLIADVRALEKRVAELEVGIAKMEQSFLKALARVLHGPSQPPPPLTGPEKPSQGNDTKNKHDDHER